MIRQRAKRLKKLSGGASSLSAVRTKSGWRVVQVFRPGFDNIVFADIDDRLVHRDFPGRRVLGHHENGRQVSWAGWLSAAKLADRHNRFFSEREALAGPELNRCDPLRTIDTAVSTEGIVEGAHATFLRLP